MKKSTGMLFAMALFIGASSTIQAEDASGPDQVRAAVQGICPVSGVKLGDHGKPIKAKIGQEEVFLCCKGCLQGKVNAKHWGTIHANFAKAQAKCHVMDKP
ncbi:MAG: hypothetical protein KDA84_23645, partial [Planctomycetaceae bacterium]|nr:hypothetical protein [Planctomycetaceae bacterium]